MSKRKIKSMKGVEIHPNRSGPDSVFIRYQVNGKPHRELVGPSMTAAEAGLPGPQSRNVTVERARRLLKERRQERQDARLHKNEWVSPKNRELQAQREATAAAEKREELRFEKAAERFLSECADEYSRPEAVRATFRLEKGGHTKRPGPLAAAFRGRYLDAITRVDIRQYYLDRMEQTGPFAGWRKVSRRAPEHEITSLSALYTFLADEGHALENPCHRPRTRRRDGALAPYQPKHEAVMPSPAGLRAILTANPRGEGKGRGVGKPGRRLVTDAHRALWALCYYTAARPESEPCRLTHGDVELPEDEGWGAVTYRDTKTGGDRRVLLHPRAVDALRAAMLPRPTRFEVEAVERWRQTPVFRRRGGGIPWDTSSYRSAWKATLAAVVGAYSEVDGMWLRDLRKVAKTRMIDAGVTELVVNRILGHRDGVAGRYYKMTDAAMQEALGALSLESRTPNRTPSHGESAVS